jgi:hypothetical protein
MDELIAELETLTLDLIEHLYESDDSRLIHFVEQREWILNQFLQAVNQTQLTEEQKNRIEELLSYDNLITARMQVLKEEASIQVNKVAAGRVQKSGYDAEIQFDSVLFDEKK